MHTDRKRREPGFGEFVALMAMMIALVALSIDAILPALSEIGEDLGVQQENYNQLLIPLLFLGLLVGQLVYGPLSDSTGRKPAVYVGYGVFILGCMFSLAATSFPIMLAGRFLQGLGAAGPRTVMVALVRDKYEGRTMAQVMSYVMTVFILVPVVAPALGQGILFVADWRTIFGAYLGMALVAWIWFALRQPETLAAKRRVPFSFEQIAMAIREILANRVALGYTITAGLIFGAFLAYLTSSQQILQQQYALGTQFPLYFGVLSLAIGAASFSNARLVMRFGMQRLSVWSLLTVGGLSVGFFPIAYTMAGHPPLWTLMSYLMISFFGIGILFGNLNALAMEPLGHIAGAGASVVGALSTFISLLFGILIGQSYAGTILPLVGGFAMLSIASLLVARWAEGGGREPEVGFSEV